MGCEVTVGVDNLIVAVINEKGGVGKTTTVGSLSHALARRGRRVLAVDLDPQANLTAWLGQDRPPEGSIANALSDPGVTAYAIGPSTAAGVELLYGSRTVADAADDLRASSLAPAAALKRALRGLEQDIVLIDCPPGVGTLSVNALAAADMLIVPVDSQAMALSGLGQLRTSLKELLDAEVIQRSPIVTVVMTKYDSRLGLAREVREYLAHSEASGLFHSAIRLSTRVAEAFGHGKTIYDYAPREGVAADYESLAAEVDK